MNDQHYYTPKEKQLEFCPKCGNKLKPLAMDNLIASTHGDGMFYACDNMCEYLELRKPA